MPQSQSASFHIDTSSIDTVMEWLRLHDVSLSLETTTSPHGVLGDTWALRMQHNVKRWSVLIYGKTLAEVGHNAIREYFLEGGNA